MKLYSFSGAILLTDRLQSRNVICHICGWNFINQVSYMLHMEHHQFDNNEWIQCKGCQRLYDTPCIFHRHVCQSHDQNNQDINNSDNITGICLLCQKFYFIQQESQTNRNQIDQPTIEENFEIQNTETTTSTKPSSSDDSNVLAPSKLHSESKNFLKLQFWEAVLIHILYVAFFSIFSPAL